MRKELSNDEKRKILIISAVVCMIIVVAVFFLVNSLTRSVLNNDDIRVNVELLSSEPYDESMSALFGSVSKDDINGAKGELCVIELRYSLYNYSDSDVGDYSVKLSSIDDEAKIYAYSDASIYGESDRICVCTQYVLLDRALVSDEYFGKEETMDFKAPMRIELSYDKDGELGRKRLSFSIVKREQ